MNSNSDADRGQGLGPDKSGCARAAVIPAGNWPHLGLVFGVLTALYLYTAPRTVVLEDDGLFIMSGFFLGIEHPPGYPLFVLLAKAATLVPFESIAWRVHALNGVISAAACCQLWLCTRSLVPGFAPAYLAALGFGVSVEFWSQALIADVYPLHALVFLILLRLALKLSEQGGVSYNPRPVGLYLFALVAGLGAANHWPLLALSAPGLLLILWPCRKGMLSRTPRLLLLFCVGLLPYAWMVWRSHVQPEISYQGSIDTWGELLGYLARTGYADVDESPSAGLEDKVSYLAFLIRSATTQMFPPATLLAAIGFYGQWRAWGTFRAMGMLAAVLGPTLGLIALLDFDYEPLEREAFRVYPLVAWSILALWAGLGFHLLLRRLPCLSPPYRKTAMVVSLVLPALIVHLGSNDRRDDWLADAYATALLEGTEPDSLLLVNGDVPTATAGYLHLVEKKRPDVLLLSEDGLVLEPKLFDPLTTPIETREGILNAYTGRTTRPHYRLSNLDRRSGLQTWLLFRPDPEGGSGVLRYDLPEQERDLLRRIAGASAFADGWSELLRRALLSRFARFATRAQSAGDWPMDDPELASLLAAAVWLPEGALMRAEVLIDLDGERHRREIDKLLGQFASKFTKKWHNKRQFARYLNLTARLAQQDKNLELMERALRASIDDWPTGDNPAHRALESARALGLLQ